MFQTTSQSYGAHYLGSPEHSAGHRRKSDLEPRGRAENGVRSLSPAKTTNLLSGALSSPKIVYKQETFGAPYIDGKKNLNFLNRSMISCDALAVPNYEGSKEGQKRDLSRYQPHISPPKDKDKGLAPKIGHPEYWQYLLNPKPASNDRNKWHRGLTTPQHTIKKLEFDREPLLVAEPPEKDLKAKPEGRNEPYQAESRGVEQREAQRFKEDTAHSMRRAVSLPREDFASGRFASSNNFDGQLVPSQYPSTHNQLGLRENIHEISRESSNTIKVEPSREDLMNEQRQAGIDTRPQEKSEEISQPRTPLSAHSHASRDSNVSGKDLVCEICVNQHLRELKQQEENLQRMKDMQRERDITQKSNALAELEKEKERQQREEARSSSQSIKEALDKKFRDYWDRRRNAGLGTSEENRLREERLAQEQRENFEAFKNRQEEYKAELLKQIEEKKEEKERERLSKLEPNQKTSIVTTGKYQNDYIVSPDELLKDYQAQIERKQEEKLKEQERDREYAEAQKKHAERSLQEEREIAEQFEKKKKDLLRKAYDEVELLKKEKKEKEIAEKQQERERVENAKELAAKREEELSRSRQKFFSDYGKELEKQLLDIQKQKEVERQKSKEPYDTTIKGFYTRGDEPNRYEELSKQETERRLKHRQELEEQLAEKKRQQEQEKLERLKPTKTGIDVRGDYYQSPLDEIKTLPESHAKQIAEKEREKAEQRERDRKLERELQEKLSQQAEDLRKRAEEKQKKMKEGLCKGLEEQILAKLKTKQAELNEKPLERSLAEEKAKQDLNSLQQQLAKKNALLKEYSANLAAQLAEDKANKLREKEESRVPYDTTINALVNSKYLQKLYSCMECTRKFPKERMVKKTALESPQKKFPPKY